MTVIAAIFSWCWAIFLVISFGFSFYKQLMSNYINLPTLFLSVYGVAFFFIGYLLWKKKKLGGILGLIFFALLFLSILLFIQWKTMAIKFNYLAATLAIPVCILFGWKKLK